MYAARKFRVGVWFLIAWSLCAVATASAAPRTASGFGNQGRVVANLGWNEVSRGASLPGFQVLPDGSFTVAVKPEGRADPLSLMKFNPDGSSDRAFGGGQVRRPTDQIAVSTARGTLVAGTIGKGMPGQDVALRRIKPNGSLDRSFGKNGLVRIDFKAMEGPSQIVVGSTGEILLAVNLSCSATLSGCGGYTWGGFGLALFEPDGKLIRMVGHESDYLERIVAADDGTYRMTGLRSSEDEMVRSGLIRIDRRLKLTAIRMHEGTPDWSGPIAMLPGNGFYAFATVNGAASVVRVRADGKLDPGFSPVGCPEENLPPETYGRGLEIDSEGRVTAQKVGGCDLMRVLPAGGLDPSFGAGGIVDLFGEYEGSTSKSMPTVDGRILVADWKSELGQLRIRRLTESGQADPSFPARVISVRQPSRDVARDVLRTGHGYVVAGNSSCDGYEPWSSVCQGFFLAAYKAGGKPNRNFGTNGFTRGGFMRVNAIARTPDGALIAAGSATRRTGPWQVERTDLALARFSASGKLDQSFGEDGLVITEIPGELRESKALDLLVGQDGKIVVTGDVEYRKQSVDPALPVLRYMPDGRPDTTFGTDGLALIGGGHLGDGQAIALAGGRILIGTMKNFRKPAVIGIRADGSLDGSFGLRGVATPRLAVRSRERAGTRFRPFREVKALKALPGGRVLAAADDGYGSQDGAVFKLRRDGTVDRRFGRRGVVYTGGLAGNALAVGRCGRITVAGSFRPAPNSMRMFGVMSITANGRPDRAFARKRVAFPLGRKRTSSATAAVSGRGRTVVTGSVRRSPTDEDMALIAMRNPRQCR